MGVPPPTPPSTPWPSPTYSAACDDTLWSHVYHPSRLKVLEQCIRVTGVVEFTRDELDGDIHIGLRLDPAYASLINPSNTQYERGDLVVEIICAHPPVQRDALDACANYISPIGQPDVGTHVRVVGAYVLDTVHGWNEIHPVTTLEAFP